MRVCKDIVSLLAALVGPDARTLSSMRAVSRTWQKGAQSQWELVRSACMLHGETSVFRWRDDKELIKALIWVFDKRDLFATRILSAYHGCDMYYVPSGRIKDGFDTFAFTKNKFEGTLVFDHKNARVHIVHRLGQIPLGLSYSPSIFVSPYADGFRLPRIEGEKVEKKRGNGL